MTDRKGRIILVLGGARSGKSGFALGRASAQPGKKTYIATAQAFDDEMRERIEKHKKERTEEWKTFEETVNVSSLIDELAGTNEVILLDCLTLWLSNLLLEEQGTAGGSQIAEKKIADFVEALHRFKNSPVADTGPGFCSLYIVSNEVGMGIVPDNALSRKFRDEAGRLNQRVAEAADEVYLVAAGIPVKLK